MRISHFQLSTLKFFEFLKVKVLKSLEFLSNNCMALLDETEFLVLDVVFIKNKTKRKKQHFKHHSHSRINPFLSQTFT